jgi:hypothetical protein
MQLNRISKITIAIALGALIVVNQLYLRPYARREGWADFVVILLGSFPNFCATLGFGLIASAFAQSLEKGRAWIISAGIGIFAREAFANSPSSISFGNVFDWNDLTATVLGCLLALWFHKKSF